MILSFYSLLLLVGEVRGGNSEATQDEADRLSPEEWCHGLEGIHNWGWHGIIMPRLLRACLEPPASESPEEYVKKTFQSLTPEQLNWMSISWGGTQKIYILNKLPKQFLRYWSLKSTGLCSSLILHPGIALLVYLCSFCPSCQDICASTNSWPGRH